MLHNRHLKIYGLLCLLVVNIFALSIITLDFRLNQDFYIENFCINKAEPQLQCHGKCHLKKKLEKTEKAENSIPSLQLEFTEPIYLELEINNTISSFLKHQGHYHIFYSELSPHGVFHPPTC
ncbi:MAG: hypothetical protein GY827_10415 [Cytophagales bacterium]|nr:hypothetical protein [Cytophagales bacterium]